LHLHIYSTVKFFLSSDPPFLEISFGGFVDILFILYSLFYTYSLSLSLSCSSANKKVGRFRDSHVVFRHPLSLGARPSFTLLKERPSSLATSLQYVPHSHYNNCTVLYWEKQLYSHNYGFVSTLCISVRLGVQHNTVVRYVCSNNYSCTPVFHVISKSYSLPDSRCILFNVLFYLWVELCENTVKSVIIDVVHCIFCK
jgi:hypothetical protein